MENVFTVSSDPHPSPAAPPSLSLPLSSSSTSSGTKKQKRTPTYQRSVSQESSHSQLTLLCVKSMTSDCHSFWVKYPADSPSNFPNHFFFYLQS